MAMAMLSKPRSAPRSSPTEREKDLLVTAGFPRSQPYFALRPGLYPSYEDFLAQQVLHLQRKWDEHVVDLSAKDLALKYGEHPLVDVLNQRVRPFSTWAQNLLDVLEKGMPHG